MREIIIIGASGHGKVIADIVIKSGDKVYGFLDDNPTQGPSFCGFPILGAVKNWLQYQDKSFVIAIGDAEVRERISKEIKAEFYTAIHPSAQISLLDTEIGKGTVIMANAVINSSAHIGKHCILNSASVVEHDSQIADFVHISVGAKLAGNVKIGKNSWVGIGASIKNGVSVCDNCTIGAGAVVVKNIKESGTYIGIPAEKL